VLLVFLLFRRLEGGERAALWVSLVFAVHPLQVEAVAWATARKDVLYALWFLLALGCWLRYAEDGRRRWYALSLAAFLLALLSKGQALVLAALLPVLDHFLGGKALLRAHRRAYLPFLGLALGFAYLAVWAQQQSGYTSAESFSTPWHWLLGNAGYALLSYMLRILVPLGLSAYYPYPVPGHDLPVWLFWAALPLAVGIAGGSTRLWWKRRAVGLGLLLFLICLAPMLRLLPVSNFITADRYTYVALPGAIWALYHVLRRLGQARREGLLAALALFFIVLTALRLPVWGDSLALLNDTLRKHPEVVPALNARGDVLLEQGDLVPAVADFSAAIRLRPGEARAYANRGRALAMAGEMDKALQDLDTAILLDPGHPGIRLNRALALARLGRTREALQELDLILSLDPGHRPAQLLRQEVQQAMRPAN